MSEAVRRVYAGLCLITRGGAYELREDGALLARTEHPAMADKLFFKRALEIACGVVEHSQSARVQLTAEGKWRFGCEGAPSPSAGRLTPPPLGEAKGDDTSSVTADAATPFLAAARATRGSDRPLDGHSLPRDVASLPQGEGSGVDEPKRAVFKKPTVDQIADYCRERGDTLTDPQAFYDYHESGGWMVGRKKMRDWKAAVRTWERKEKERQQEKAEREKRFERPRKGVELTNPEHSSLRLDEFEQDLLHYRPKFRGTERSEAG